eukprot:scaffold30238_cov129-Isochrysis_galbana.AAC.2
MSAQDLDAAFRDAVTSSEGAHGGWQINNDERVKYVGKLEVKKGDDTLKVCAPLSAAGSAACGTVPDSEFVVPFPEPPHGPQLIPLLRHRSGDVRGLSGGGHVCTEVLYHSVLQQVGGWEGRSVAHWLEHMLASRGTLRASCIPGRVSDASSRRPYP